MELRPYQIEAVNAVLAARERGLRRVLYVLPTGTGKTQVFCGIRQRMGGRALILAHREELLDQAANRFLSVDARSCPAVEQGSRKAPRWAQVVAASVQTLARGTRLDWFQPSLIVVDEAHHAVSPTHKKVLERFGAFAEGGPYLVGCTATPRRLDNHSLTKVFEEQVYSYGLREAIRDGWLSEIRGFRVRTKTDLSKVRRVAGDYVQADLEKAVDAEERTGEAIRHWLEVARERATIAFCVGVQHAEHVAEAFREQGVTADCIHGGMSREARAQTLARFQHGHTQVLTNVDILTEGFDHPPTSCVLMMRPTQSWALYVQCVGRGTRLAPGKADVIVIDVVDNSERHSLATVPAMLDLPPDLDLQGRTLSEAANKLDALALAGRATAAALEEYQPKLFADLDTMLEQVDLLAGAAVPPEASAAGCKLHWLKLPSGGFLLDVREQGRICEARLEQDQLDHWHLTMAVDGQIVKRGRAPVGPEAGASDALALADRAVQRAWPAATAFATNAAWRQQPATDKQLYMLRQRGVAPELLTGLDRGRASALITQLVQRTPAGVR